MNGNRSLIIPQFQKNLINFQGKSAPFFPHLSNSFPKFHNIQLSEFTLRLFDENPRGYIHTNNFIIIYSHVKPQIHLLIEFEKFNIHR